MNTQITSIEEVEINGRHLVTYEVDGQKLQSYLFPKALRERQQTAEEVMREVLAGLGKDYLIMQQPQGGSDIILNRQECEKFGVQWPDTEGTIYWTDSVRDPIGKG